MPDFQDFRITHLSNATISVPRMQVEGRITDSQTGATLFDYTGANAVTFPGVMSQLTQAQRRELFESLAQRVLRMKAGLE